MATDILSILAEAQKALRTATERDALFGDPVHIVYGDAIRRLCEAGLAANYQDAVKRYAHRFEHTRCNVITRASLAAILQEGEP